MPKQPISPQASEEQFRDVSVCFLRPTQAYDTATRKTSQWPTTLRAGRITRKVVLLPPTVRWNDNFAMLFCRPSVSSSIPQCSGKPPHAPLPRPCVKFGTTLISIGTPSPRKTDANRIVSATGNNSSSFSCKRKTGQCSNPNLSPVWSSGIPSPLSWTSSCGCSSGCCSAKSSV